MTSEKDSLRPDNANIVPPTDTSYKWECSPRYEVFHKHGDGRPLCQFCQYWNPAPFPNGRLPRQVTEYRQFLHSNSERGAINAMSGMHLFLFLSDSIELSEFNSFCRYYN